jgi:hypothetical protein
MGYEQTRIRIRERSGLELLDLSLRVIRRWPRPIGLAAVAGIAPFAAVDAWLLATTELPVPLWLGLLVLQFPWATAPLTVVLGGLLFGETPRVSQVVRRLANGFFAMILVQLIVRGLLLATVLLYPIVPSRLAFTNEVILLERARGFRSLRRSWNLSRNREGDLFVSWLIHLAYGALFVVCFTLGTTVLARSIVQTETTWDSVWDTEMLGPRTQLAVWLAIAFFGVVRFLTYIDQRNRIEGWSVDLSLRAVGRALERGNRS